MNEKIKLDNDTVIKFFQDHWVIIMVAAMLIGFIVDPKMGCSVKIDSRESKPKVEAK